MADSSKTTNGNGKGTGPSPLHLLDAVFEDERATNIRAAAAVLRKQTWTIVLTAAFITGSVALWTLAQPKTYQASTTLQIDLESPKVLGHEVEQVEELGDTAYWNTREYLTTQYDIASGHAVARRTVDALRLDRNERYLRDTAPNLRAPANPDKVADALRLHLTVSPVRATRLFTVAYEGYDPALAQQIANAVADAYLQQNIEHRLDATEQAVRWLGEQNQTLRQELEKSEHSLYGFRREHNILSLSLEDQQNIATARVRELSEALTKARVSRIEAGVRKDRIASLELADPLSPAAEKVTDANDVLAKLKQRYADVQAELVKAASHYGPEHPKLRGLTAEQEQLTKDMAAGARQLLRSYEADFEAAQRNEDGLQKALDQAQQEALRLSEYEIKYNELRRERDNNEKLFGLVLSRSKETDLSRLLRVNNVRVLDAARKPDRPFRPRVFLNLAAGLVLGMFSGVGLAFLIESLDLTVKTQKELELLDLLFLGILPTIDSTGNSRSRRSRKKGGALTPVERDLFIADHPKSNVAECMRTVRTNLLFTAEGRELRTLVVTSPGPLEGKTTVTVGLAVSMAQNGDRVLLVDTDMRRPRLHRALGMTNTVGLSSLIVGAATLEQAIQPTRVPGVSFLPCGPIPPNPAELLQGDHFREVSDELRQRFDRVIYDSPPIGAVTDAAILGRTMDGVIVVAKALKTRKDGTARTVQQLRAVGARILGAILNDVGPSARGYYHYYYRRYGTYYEYNSDNKDAKDAREHAAE